MRKASSVINLLFGREKFDGRLRTAAARVRRDLSRRQATARAESVDDDRARRLRKNVVDMDRDRGTRVNDRNCIVAEQVGIRAGPDPLDPGDAHTS